MQCFLSPLFFFFLFSCQDTLQITEKILEALFGLRNILFTILRPSHLLDVSVLLFTLSIMKKEKDEHFLLLLEKSELKKS